MENNKKQCIIYNDEFMKEWDWDKNYELGLDPYVLTEGSGKKTWWICERGHEYDVTPKHKSQGYGCPYCSGRRVLEGFNDLATTHPDIASEWNYDKNDGLLPTQVTHGSTKKVWWICDKGHEWEATISNRVNGRGCPVCLRKKVVAGINDLATSHPNLVSEWDTNKNIIAPTEVSSGSSKKVWWKCKDCGYEWQTAVHVRAKGHGCPKCANIRKGPNKNNKISLIDNEEYILI